MDVVDEVAGAAIREARIFFESFVNRARHSLCCSLKLLWNSRSLACQRPALYSGS